MSLAEPAIDESPFSSVVVGGGPGGMGPLLWAAQYGLLDAWLKQGVALVERSGRLGGTLGRYGICSDSLGGSYLECLEAEALAPSFHPLREQPTTIAMQRYRQSFPPLPLVDRYMGDIGQAMAARTAPLPWPGHCCSFRPPGGSARGRSPSCSAGRRGSSILIAPLRSPISTTWRRATSAPARIGSTEWAACAAMVATCGGRSPAGPAPRPSRG